MLTKERQKKRFKAIGKAMHGHITAFFELQNPEELHHFRVQVKKMKALLFFLQNGVLEKHETEHLRSVQYIFKHAGRIRIAHTNIGLLMQYPVTDLSYITEQENIEKNEIKQFIARHHAYIKTVKSIRKGFADAFRDINDKNIVACCKKRLKKIFGILKQSNDCIDKWHKIRKKIKNLLYLYQILPKSLARKLHLNDVYLEHLQEAIGKWHDVVLLLKFLTTEAYANRNEIIAIHREKRRLCRSVQKLSDNFDQKAGKI